LEVPQRGDWEEIQSKEAELEKNAHQHSFSPLKAFERGTVPLWDMHSTSVFWGLVLTELSQPLYKEEDMGPLNPKELEAWDQL
jgi:hypothetical protein